MGPSERSDDARIGRCATATRYARGMVPLTLQNGDTPLVVSVPHAGTHLADDVAARLAPAARSLPDTDWHVDKLVEGIGGLGATILVATHARMQIDLNRPADDAPLYPGQAGTGLIPETLFDGRPAWLQVPTAAERAARIKQVWRPYHAALEQSLARAKARHGYAILWDVHSIRGRVPRLFDGRLPDLNLGTNDGASCASGVRDAAAAVLAASPFTHVVDGRFKGGFITRHHGQPSRNVHAVQLEMALHTYVDARVVPPPWDPVRAAGLRRVLEDFATALLRWRP